MTRTLNPDDWMTVVGTDEELVLDAWIKRTAGFDTTDRLIESAKFDDDTMTLSLVCIDEMLTPSGDEIATETLTFTATEPPPLWPQASDWQTIR